MLNEKEIKKASKVVLGGGTVIGIPFFIFLFATFPTKETAQAQHKALQAVDQGIIKVLESNNAAVIRELKNIQTNQVNLNKRIDVIMQSR